MSLRSHNFNGPIIFHEYTYHNLLSQCSLVEHFGCFQLFITMNNALKSVMHIQTVVSHSLKWDDELICTG